MNENRSRGGVLSKTRQAVPTQFEPLMSAEETAQLLGGLHPKTVMRWARQKSLPGFQIGRGWFFPCE